MYHKSWLTEYVTNKKPFICPFLQNVATTWFLKGSKIRFSALNNGKTVRKACQDCALCGVPPPKWPSIPEDAALSNISWWDVMEKCMTSSAMEQQGSSDLGTKASVMTNIIGHRGCYSNCCLVKYVKNMFKYSQILDILNIHRKIGLDCAIMVIFVTYRYCIIII